MKCRKQAMAMFRSAQEQYVTAHLGKPFLSVSSEVLKRAFNARMQRYATKLLRGRR